MSWKKRIGIGIMILLMGVFSLGIYCVKSEKAQLSIQVKAANHIKTLLPLLPEEMIDHDIVMKYSELVDTVLEHIDMKVVSHTKKTANTGVAVIEVKAPVIAGQTMNAILISEDKELLKSLEQKASADDIDTAWLVETLNQKISEIDFAAARYEIVRLEVPTFSNNGMIWSFSKDAIEEAVREGVKQMGFDSRWLKDLMKALP